MLVLSRKKGEAIQIADEIKITIVDIRGGRVRLSIEAPRSVRVVRNELLHDLNDGDTFVVSERALQISGS